VMPAAREAPRHAKPGGGRRPALLALALALAGAACAAWGAAEGWSPSAPPVVLLMPGEDAFDLRAGGTHAVYHEDARFLGPPSRHLGPELGGLACALEGPEGPVPLVDASRAYSYSDGASRRAGVSAWTFESTPGRHVLSCAYPEGEGDAVALAVWTPPLAPFLRLVAVLAGGVLVAVGGGLAARATLRR